MTIARNDVVTHIQPGGGGFGEPLVRDFERIRQDVWNHKLTAAFVLEHYKVVVDSATGEIDVPSTAALRAKLLAKAA